MEAALSKTLKIDKSDWDSVKFGDVVSEPRDTVKNIAAEGIEHVVGLEHIETGNIHLRNSAGIEESTTFTKKFAPGDVLFGRRRAYLKKAAQASFCGICSGDITVLRAKKGLLPELLPFIVNSDKFFDHAIKHSAGGLSPRVKFKDLANYEFLLPPKDQQAQLAELLWAMDEVIEKEELVIHNIETLRDSLYKKFNNGGIDWNKYRIKDLMSFQYGKPLKELDRIEGNYPVVSSAGIQGTHIDFVCKGPGIVVGRKGNAGEVTWVENNFWPIDTAYYITIENGFSELPLKFFYYLLKAANLKKYAIATAVPGLNRDDAILSSVFLPNKNEIFEYLNQFEGIDKRLLLLEFKVASSKALQKSLINQIF